jgi:WD40-like Beta Propeller Repeat
LTTDGHDMFPAWSRNGKQIAFVRGDLRQRFFCPLFIQPVPKRG